MDIKVRFNRTSWVGWLTTTDMLVWLMFGIFIYFSCDQVSELTSTLRIKSRRRQLLPPLGENEEKDLHNQTRAQNYTPNPPLDPTCASLTKSERARKRESKAESKELFCWKAYSLYLVRGNTKRDEGAVLCQTGQRYTGVALTRPVFLQSWSASSVGGWRQGRTSRRSFYGLTGTTALRNGRKQKPRELTANFTFHVLSVTPLLPTCTPVTAPWLGPQFLF